MRKTIQKLRNDERGMSLVLIGGGFIAFMTASILAVDVGMLVTARTQAQSAADSGALAGATSLAFNDYNDRTASGPAVQASISASQQNKIMTGTPSVLPADVTFPLSPSGQNNRVQVTVWRTATRGNAIPTFIGPLIGAPTANMGATAVAEASPASAATCVKPFMIPDRWREVSNPPFDPMTSTFDMYDKKGNLLPASSRDVYVPSDQAGYTGYTIADKGTLLILRAGTGNNIEPTMYYSWSMPGDIGGNYYRDNIAGCNTTLIPLSINPPYLMTQEPGNMVGPTDQGMDDLIAKDPSAVWDGGCKCVKNSAFGISPRVTPLPLYDPVYYATGKVNGRTADFKLANVMGFFIDHRSGNQIYGYITTLVGMQDPNGGPAPTGAFPMMIRLVQ